MSDDVKEGPTHYEGWTCEGCEHLRTLTHSYCFEQSIRETYANNRIEDCMHTPNWCPFIKGAILMHVMEECS